jgi:hypothetical protein
MRASIIWGSSRHARMLQEASAFQFRVFHATIAQLKNACAEQGGDFREFPDGKAADCQKKNCDGKGATAMSAVVPRPTQAIRTAPASRLAEGPQLSSAPARVRRACGKP